MIEVEKKFLLTDADIEKLTRNAQFLNERSLTDVYYDNDTFTLTGSDKWLRSRNDKFELKLPLYDGPERLADQYDEIEEEEKIKELLEISSEGILKDALNKKGYYPFCSCKTIRKKYKKETFIIDLDKVDFGDFVYNLGEIELMVKSKSEISNAIQKIISFAKENNLTIAPVRGKIIEYIKRTKPDQYEVLIKNGVVKDF